MYDKPMTNYNFFAKKMQHLSASIIYTLKVINHINKYCVSLYNLLIFFPYLWK